MCHHLVIGAGGIGRATASGPDPGWSRRHPGDPQRVPTPTCPASAAVAGDAASVASMTGAAAGRGQHRERGEPPQVHPVGARLAARGGGTAGRRRGDRGRTGHRVEPVRLRTRRGPDDRGDAAASRTARRARSGPACGLDALAAHEAGRLRATELRASDYFGPGASAGTSYLNQYVIGPAAAGRAVRLVMGEPDVPHSWTYLDDIGALAAVLATDERSWGRAWHVPTAAPLTLREAATAAALAGGPIRSPRVSKLPAPVKLAARVAPLVRELDETAHQFERPFVLDSSLATATFGLTPTPWPESLAATCRPWLRAAGPPDRPVAGPPGPPAGGGQPTRVSTGGGGAVGTGGGGVRSSLLGHQILPPRSRLSAVTSTDRTISVSSRTPSATATPISARNTSGSVPSTRNVAASTRPAEVITPPVAASATSEPSRVPRVCGLLADPGHQEDVVVDAQGDQEHERRTAGTTASAPAKPKT